MLKTGFLHNDQSLKRYLFLLKAHLIHLIVFLILFHCRLLLYFLLFAAYKTNGIKFAVFTFLSLVFIDLLDIWEETMTTMAMIVTAVLFCCLIGIPLGIAASRNDVFEIILRPILDVMQTIPSFVYLIPVVMLFGVGLTPVSLQLLFLL